MRPSSSPSEPKPVTDSGGLFGAVLGRGAAAARTSDAAFLRALLDTEAALARAHAAVGSAPADEVALITGACAGDYDVAAIGAAAAATGNPVVPLVREIGRRLPTPATAYLHLGATSQDVMDTAWMLVARNALTALDDDLAAVADTLATLSRRHRDDVVTGRTLMQSATPTTFGLVAATWLTGVDGVRMRLGSVAATLPVQLGGAVGTLTATNLDAAGAAGLIAAFAAETGLAEPVLAWHAVRLPVTDLAGALGATAGVAGKIAHDIVLSAQTEVAELREEAPGRGGSSTMPHKANPVAAISARASVLRAPGLVATLFACLDDEHQRAAGSWHAEWLALRDLLRCTSSAVSWLRASLDSLVVDVGRMRDGVDPTSAAEAVAGVLTPHLGRDAGHELVARVVAAARADGTPLAQALLADRQVAQLLDAGQVAELLDPARAGVGNAGLFVDRALAAHTATTPDKEIP